MRMLSEAGDSRDANSTMRSHGCPAPRRIREPGLNLHNSACLHVQGRSPGHLHGLLREIDVLKSLNTFALLELLGVHSICYFHPSGLCLLLSRHPEPFTSNCSWHRVSLLPDKSRVFESMTPPSSLSPLPIPRACLCSKSFRRLPTPPKCPRLHNLYLQALISS